MLNKIEHLIDTCKVVSFDIFDTLLLRPFCKPEDVFGYISQLYNKPEFIVKRIAAEKIAFRKIMGTNREDITFDEIYENLPEEYKHFKDIEMATEEQILQINSEMLEIYNFARNKNKKIIITSDMYLPKEFLIKILHEKGISNFNNLYVSNEYSLTKRTGNLYKYILKDLNVMPGEIIHIGDNKESDILTAQKLGLQTYHYNKIQDRLLLQPEYHYLKNKNIASQIVGSILVNEQKDSNPNYWYSLGFKFGGLLIYSFVSELSKILKIRGIQNVFFIARDSFQVYETFKKYNKNSNINAYYVYASRILKNKYYNSKDATVSNEYIDYIKSFPLAGNKVAIVDTCADTFSAQTLIEAAVPENEYLGIYLVAKNNYKFNYINLANSDFPKTFKWLFIEAMLDSLETPIIGLKENKPIFREINTEEQQRINIFKEIAKGENDSLLLYKQMFGDNSTIPISEIFYLYSCFWNNMSELDRKELDKLKQPNDTNQNMYIPVNINAKDLIFTMIRSKMKEKNNHEQNISNNTHI